MSECPVTRFTTMLLLIAFVACWLVLGSSDWQPHSCKQQKDDAHVQWPSVHVPENVLKHMVTVVISAQDWTLAHASWLCVGVWQVENRDWTIFQKQTTMPHCNVCCLDARMFPIIKDITCQIKLYIIANSMERCLWFVDGARMKFLLLELLYEWSPPRAWYSLG